MSDLQDALKWVPWKQDIKDNAPDESSYRAGVDMLNVIREAAKRVANGERIYQCSQHGFRGTPRCNDNPDCHLSLGVWVGITEDTE